MPTPSRVVPSEPAAEQDLPNAPQPRMGSEVVRLCWRAAGMAVTPAPEAAAALAGLPALEAVLVEGGAGAGQSEAAVKQAVLFYAGSLQGESGGGGDGGQ